MFEPLQSGKNKETAALSAWILVDQLLQSSNHMDQQWSAISIGGKKNVLSAFMLLKFADVLLD